jgi:putative DNA primase/helicase
MISAAELTRALGGRWYGRYGLARCFTHDDHAPSLSIIDGNGGPLLTCFSGCRRRDIYAELRRRGLLDDWPQRSASPATRKIAATRGPDDEKQGGMSGAVALWKEGQPLSGLALQYFDSRRIADLSALPDIHRVLRFHPHCPFGPNERHLCITALWTDALTAEPRAIHRTALKPDGRRLGRMSLGPTAGCVIRLWPDDTVTRSLVVGEGIETTLSAALRIEHRGTLLQPAWAAGDAGHLAKFQVLAGIEALTILADNDESGRGEEAARECEQRWLAAGREVVVLTPQRLGADFNDLGGAA